ncbi:MAG TPA: hypothetical protein VFB60_04365 [Ktedonobacteraceae bacterium]|nr:hypothetical protein [Ktedonobacteraceae bacterium]
MHSTKHFYAGRWLFVYVLMIMVLAACSTPSAQPSSSTTQAARKSSPTPVPGAPRCQPSSPITTSAIGLPEVRGTTNAKTELWALLFNAMNAGQELKIVWRMTGNGDIQAVAQGPHGQTVQPKWVSFHSGSNWNRPGPEWGTGFVLPEPGCWDFHVSRTDASGDVWLLVK